MAACGGGATLSESAIRVIGRAGQVDLAVAGLGADSFYGRANNEALRAAFPAAHRPVRYRSVTAAAA